MCPHGHNSTPTTCSQCLERTQRVKVTRVTTDRDGTVRLNGKPIERRVGTDEDGTPIVLGHAAPYVRKHIAKRHNDRMFNAYARRTRKP